MFYLLVQGQILLDGHDISTLNLRWLRQQISLVSQAHTIYDNIRQGLIGSQFEQDS
jgi:ATP-binding cassette, subfamily B (MDR/TAP), member 1